MKNKPLTTRRPLSHAWIALALSFALLGISAYQLWATLDLTQSKTEVTKAVAAGLATDPARSAVMGFLFALLALHIGYAVAIAFLGASSSRLSGKPDQRVAHTILWFALGTLAILWLNGLWFPRTESGAYYHSIGNINLWGLPLALVFGSAIAIAAVAVAGLAVLQSVRTSTAARVALCAAITLALSPMVFGLVHFGAPANATDTKPHIIVLGVDSLRLGELARNGGSGKTPHIDKFIESADIFDDVTTPVARTFPSWVSILTGRAPRETGAVFNLVPRELISATPNLAGELRTAGYKTVLATDETRFSNIDQSYGFDQLVTPGIGAVDFFLGKITDLPLANVVANTKLGGWLFPYAHANRAVATLFKPKSFVNRLDDEVDFRRPTFLVTHLCAAHWPYYVAGIPADADQRAHPNDRPLYDAGLAAADAMFGDIVAMLERKGALRNAIVVVLSDHGEGLAVPGDFLLGDDPLARIEGLQVPVNKMDWGHGQSVLTPVQYRTLLAFRAFGVAGYHASGRTLHSPATTLDVAPTLFDFIGMDRVVGSGKYAESLRPLLRGDAPDLARRLMNRPRFTETDLRATIDVNGDVDEKAAARDGSLYFGVDGATGRLQLDPRSFPVLLAFKERAVFKGPYLLAALPADLTHHQYILVNQRSGTGRILSAAPTADDADAFALWQDLHAYFGEELRPPTVLTPEVMPEVYARWEHLLREAKRARLTAAN
jgi:arylsulfatase A-like enzyme